ncbi:hypothetical protein ACIQVO_19665 [Streptomyces sp. NPDC101062]|uniref:hypothetical protein n=1 Tax=unclassified Streptomyces TaxID=2593676 RepID=UPI002E76F52C|nr:hypothetical protein [Streptomyces sp. JV176]MEE1802362.1 hypothetical protein [Streptomyces sp. JV176]
MPRPTAAQLAYGSATIVCSTLAMLLLSGTSTGIGVAVIGVAALGLGLLVAMTVPLPRKDRAARAATPRHRTGADTTARATVAAPRTQGSGVGAEARR